MLLSEVRRCVLWQAVVALMEMGFDENEVIDALRVNNNQQDAAVSVKGKNFRKISSLST